VLNNRELWKATGKKLMILEVRMRKWRWIGRTLKKGDESIEKHELDLNLHGIRRRERPKETWRRTVLEEAGKCGKT
jgi:hypothetical protein